MTELPHSISLTRCLDETNTLGTLVTLDRGLAQRLIDPKWWGKHLLKEQSDEPDKHWCWRKVIGREHNNPYVFAVAALHADQVEGAMVYRADGASVLVDDTPAVLLSRLATAPWNRPWLTDSPRLRGVGTHLVRWAAYQSYLLGFGGRLIAPAVPRQKTYDFYEHLGFKRTPSEADGMNVFELEPSDARTLLLGDSGLT